MKKYRYLRKKKICPVCNRKYFSISNKQHFCSNTCWRKNYDKRYKKKCLYCKKMFFTYSNKAKFCSRLHCVKYFHKYKIGWHSKKHHALIAKKSVETNRKNHTGCFFDPKWQRKHGLKVVKKMNAICRKKKIGFFSPILHRKLIENLIKNSKYKWYNVGFLSKGERDCAKILLKRPKANYNCHIRVGTRTIDFFPQKNDKKFQNTFVEFHPCNNFLHPESRTKYYNLRRKILDENDYKNNELILIENLGELR